MNKNCLLCGVGGQGVILASKLIAYAAMEKGLQVRTTETIGMSQRGGSVVSHVRMGEAVHSPMIPKGKADILLAFEPAEAVRNLVYLREGGVVVVNRKAVKSAASTLSQDGYQGPEMLEFLSRQNLRLYVADGEALCAQAGSPKVLNVALLGAAAASKALDLTPGDLETQIRRKVKPSYVDMNLKALALGAKVEKEGRPSR
ncbi:pyruvate ferredoxin oxidoreductase [Lachnospiraceae bacterium KGMB03038]|nr:pyruvate ferredoxin oxidoreductase [Lachnospiraceae bacterium KGMB03038]